MLLIPIFLTLTLTFGLESVHAEESYDYVVSQDFNSGSSVLHNFTTDGDAGISDNALYLNGSYNNYKGYTFDFSYTSFELEFDFKKTNDSAYSRLIYFIGPNLEVEVKGSSNSLYIQGEYSGNWKMNEWSHFRFVYKNKKLYIYLNDSLIRNLSCSNDITAFQIGKGASSFDNLFTGYVDNLVVRANSYAFKENIYLNDLPGLPIPFIEENFENNYNGNDYEKFISGGYNYCSVFENGRFIICATQPFVGYNNSSDNMSFYYYGTEKISWMAFYVYDGSSSWSTVVDNSYLPANHYMSVSRTTTSKSYYASNFELLHRDTGAEFVPQISNKVIFPHISVEPTITYDHQETFLKNDISSFYFNAVNPASSGLFQFKIEFESNNGIFPDYNFKYLTMGLDDTTYNEEDDSISGFGFDYDDCVTSDNKMTCTGQIDLSLISSKRPNTTYYRWEQDIFNFDELDGTFTVYYTELANFGFATQESALKDLYKYMITSKDVLVSPNGEFDLYFNKDVRLWVYDTYNNAYKSILTTVLNENNYYYIHVATDEKNYLRIKTDDSSYVVYSNVSGLNFATVGENGDVSISIPGEENQNSNIGTGSEPSKEDIENGKWDSIESATNKISLIFKQNKGLIQSIFKIPKMLFGALPEEVQTVTAGLLFFFITAVLIKMMWR